MLFTRSSIAQYQTHIIWQIRYVKTRIAPAYLTYAAPKDVQAEQDQENRLQSYHSDCLCLAKLYPGEYVGQQDNCAVRNLTEWSFVASLQRPL